MTRFVFAFCVALVWVMATAPSSEAFYSAFRAIGYKFPIIDTGAQLDDGDVKRRRESERIKKQSFAAQQKFYVCASRRADALLSTDEPARAVALAAVAACRELQSAARNSMTAAYASMGVPLLDADKRAGEMLDEFLNELTGIIVNARARGKLPNFAPPTPRAPQERPTLKQTPI